MKTVPLTQGQYTIVDEEDYQDLVSYKWHAGWNPNTHSFYARNNDLGRMHTYLLKPEPGMNVDHINHDTLDNRRENIRIVTCQQNHMNRRVKTRSSRFKGVCWHNRDRRWRAQITKGRKMHLGNFENEEDAAIAYNVAAQLLFGEYANINSL